LRLPCPFGYIRPMRQWTWSLSSRMRSAWRGRGCRREKVAERAVTSKGKRPPVVEWKLRQEAICMARMIHRQGSSRNGPRRENRKTAAVSRTPGDARQELVSEEEVHKKNDRHTRPAPAHVQVQPRYQT